MSEDTYNGWEGKGTKSSAYATWRVCLELIDDSWVEDSFPEKPTAYDLADWLENYAAEIVRGEDYQETQIATRYAMAFLDDVNWDEIAEHILLDWDD